VGHLGAVFYRFTMPRLTNAQKLENYRKRKKEAEQGSQRPKQIRKIIKERKLHEMPVLLTGDFNLDTRPGKNND
jgi:endonuclease/exonuclease/phosphatase (EEP) superfamily protein YafD